MCRTGGRRCPSHSDPTKIAARNQRRREQYAQQKLNATLDKSDLQTNTTVLTDTQREYFKNSKVSQNGNPVPLYHGSSVEFDSFNPEFLGRGNDAWGNGFYFTDQESVARGYASESGSPTANVKEFYLNLTNPIYVDGKENMSLNNITFTSEVAAKILKQHPNAYLQPNESDEEMNFLGDYSETYWDKNEFTKQELDQMINKVAKDYFENTSWVELENVFGKEHGAAFLHAIHTETGHDGVIVDFGDDGKHYVAWFPNQMKLTTNVNPTDTHTF